MAPAAQQRPAVRTIVTHHETVLIVDKKNMLRLWLEEKVARRELSPAAADKMLHDQEDGTKTFGSPLKDGIGNVTRFRKIAQDFGSWKRARVEFHMGKKGEELVTFKGWPAGRKIISGVRYRVDNPKMIEMQIGRPGLKAGAHESARFGIVLVVGVDVLDYLTDDHATFGSLLGHLTVDIPSVMVASAAGAVIAAEVAGTTVTGLAMIGSLALGPLAVAFAVGFLAGVLLYEADKHWKLSEKLGHLYDQAISKLEQVWHQLGAEAEARYRQLANSQLVHDLRQDAAVLAQRIGRQADLVRGELAYLW